MRLAWVELRDFRNHAHTRIEPVPDGLIVAVGPNGEGKTNLLEGIDYLCALSSPRVSARVAIPRPTSSPTPIARPSAVVARAFPRSDPPWSTACSWLRCCG